MISFRIGIRSAVIVGTGAQDRRAGYGRAAGGDRRNRTAAARTRVRPPPRAGTAAVPKDGFTRRAERSPATGDAP
ncbi:hypothetical protein GCM10010106_20050 [Thermopolyspora flexuosa]|nr:hypothetical protein GCM10010106_20050 [Thermopolyspora flexuosa]